MRPYNRSLDPADYDFLTAVPELRMFQQAMQANHVPHREWHPHRFWEYGSVLQQLTELGVPSDVEIIDVGAGFSFFDPYLALKYPRLCEVDRFEHENHSWQVQLQRDHFNVALPLYQLSVEDLSPRPDIGWDGGHEKFDVTLCISVIEHVHDHDAGMRELVRITKPGGYVFITSDYFRDLEHFEQSASRSQQVTAYRKEFVEVLPERFGLEFVGNIDFDYRGDFVHNYSFCNLCLRKPV
jgi:2-polyprenyl-3-methyl-5-hydroxy-6-metoxy-1,4-benzoquinol methylase